MEVGNTSYDTCLSQVFSPCKNYLVIGNESGQISVINVAHFLKLNTIGRKSDVIKFQSLYGPANSLASDKKFCIAGTIGTIVAWNWKHIVEEYASKEQPKCAWSIRIPAETNDLRRMDILSLVLRYNAHESDDVDDGMLGGGGGGDCTLFAACANNNIYQYDMDCAKLLRVFRGHSDYIHSLTFSNGNDLASASEDGSVKIWDTRAGTCSSTIEPYKEDVLERKQIGKWVGDVHVKDNALLCGGGVKLSLWSLRTNKLLSDFCKLEGEEGLHCTRFHEDMIIAAGRAPYVFILDYDGDVKSQTKTSCVAVYSLDVIRHHLKPKNNIYTFCGSGNVVDICSSSEYCDWSIPLRRL